MPTCEYLKRNAAVCGEPGVRGGVLCRRHQHSIAYVMCASGCGKVVSSKHNRPSCTKCQPPPDKRRIAAGPTAIDPVSEPE